jgi:hypothetical protein
MLNEISHVQKTGTGLCYSYVEAKIIGFLGEDWLTVTKG